MKQRTERSILCFIGGIGLTFIVLAFMTSCTTLPGGEKRFDAKRAMGIACAITPGVNGLGHAICESLPVGSRDKCRNIQERIQLYSQSLLAIGGAFLGACGK